LLVEKIKCCAERIKSRDAEDVDWIVENREDIMSADVGSRISPEAATDAIKNHPSLAHTFSSLGLTSTA
jgi:hypothetical protein